MPVCRSDACAPDEPFEVRGIRRNGAGAGIVQSPATGQASGRRAARDATVHAVRIISRGLSRNLPPVLGIVRGGRPLSVIRWLATVRVISDDGSGGTEPRCLAGHSLLSDARFQVLCSPIGPYPRSADLPVRKRGDLRATLNATELKPRQDPLDESWHGKALPAPSLRLGTSDPPGAALSPIYSARYRCAGDAPGSGQRQAATAADYGSAGRPHRRPDLGGLPPRLRRLGRAVARGRRDPTPSPRCR